MNYLLHSSVCIPENIMREAIKLQKDSTKLKKSFHVSEYIETAEAVRNNPQERLTIDKKHDFTTDELMSAIYSIVARSIEPFEVEVTDFNNQWKVTKYVCRAYVKSRGKDLVVVFRPKKDKTALIATAWWNENDDKHFTLDEEHYLSKEQVKQLHI